MKIAVASDHAGYELKKFIMEELRKETRDLIDLGAHNTTPSDYPDFARAIGQAIISGKADRGILVCGSGVGACVAANKIKGIRAGLLQDTYSAHQGVEHDDINVLCLGARVIGPMAALEIVQAFLGAEFNGEERHVRRLKKINEIEERQQ